MPHLFPLTLIKSFPFGRLAAVRKLLTAAVFGSLVVLAGCTSTAESREEFNDPWESFNRGVFEFNRVVDRAILRPISSGYRAVFPSEVRQGVSNVIDNLFEPLNFIHLLLQGRPADAADTLARFVINSTIGVGGIFDVASDGGPPKRTEDLGQTLAVWGVPDGPYVVLPIFGPSTVRDGFGLAVDSFGNPVNFAINDLNVSGLQESRFAVQIIDFRSRLHTTLDALYAEKDPYAFARVAYRQQRQFAICNGRCPDDGEQEDPFAFEEDY